jgi:hypothetical protein
VKKKFAWIWPAVAFFAIVGQPVSAHHSFPAEFDKSKSGEVSGTIVEVWFKNPHARYKLEVQGEDGAAEIWDIQSSSLTSLRSAGWTVDTLKVGESVRIWGDLGHNNTKKVYLRGVEKSDGTEIFPGGAVRSANERNRVTASPDKTYSYAQVNTDHPFDISGPWSNFHKFQLTVDDLEPKPTPFSAEGRRVFESTESWQDDVLRCLPLGLPRVFGSPYAMEIVDAGSHYIILHVQNNTPRRVWMDDRRPPADLQLTSMGFSVGHWEEETLVIETTHLSPGTLDGSLLPMSGAGTRLVERWEFGENQLSVDRTMTIHDPYYSKPLVRRRGSVRADGIEIIEAAPCDPDGHYRDLLETGRLEDHLIQ